LSRLSASAALGRVPARAFRQTDPAIAAAAIAAPLAGSGPLQGPAATFMLWLLVESLLCAFKGWSLTCAAPLILVARDRHTDARASDMDRLG